MAVEQALRAVDELRAAVETGPSVEKPAPPPRSLLEDIAVPDMFQILNTVLVLYSTLYYIEL